jgi:hypothetical protein
MNKLEELIHHFKKTLSPDKDDVFGRVFYAYETIGIFFEIVLIAPIEAGFTRIQPALSSYLGFLAFMVGLKQQPNSENV